MIYNHYFSIYQKRCPDVISQYHVLFSLVVSIVQDNVVPFYYYQLYNNKIPNHFLLIVLFEICRYFKKIEQEQSNKTPPQHHHNPRTIKSKNNQMQEQHIYRYEFNKEFMIELYNFSKIHQYDDRKEFKSAWDVWAEEHLELIEEETRRLVNLNYEGDVKDKMFRSARYYFRKKTPEKKEEAQRRKYTCVDRDIINAMDQHIDKNLSSVKPSTAFLDFCKENLDLLSEEIARLYSESITADDIKKKIKKTYKNRYFLKVNIG